MFGNSLYKKVVFLTFTAVFVSLFTEYVLIFIMTDTINQQKNETSALLTASTLAQMPKVVQAVADEGEDNEEASTFVAMLSKVTVSNIVVFDAQQRVVFASAQVADEDYIGKARELVFVQSTGNGYAGRELRNRPYYYDTVYKDILDSNGDRIGVVVVAELSSPLELQQSYENLFLIFLANLVGLLVGILGSMFLAKNIKDVLFGLEPEAIAKLLEERIAMIDSVQEGVLSTNKEGKVILLNASGRKIFEYAGFRPDNPVGMNIDDIYDSGMKEVLTNGVAHINYEEKINNVTVITNQLPIKMNNEIVGAITTFRMKTELEELAQQLTGVRAYVDALRAQTHEFMNKIHVVLGLVELEKYDELRHYIKNVAAASHDEARYINRRLKNHVLSGFVLGKMSRARELDIDFSLTEESYLPAPIAQAYVDKIISIVGNLINNAFEALAHCNDERIVFLSMLVFEDELVVTVEDSGQGIPEPELEKIFRKGFSSKGDDRGIGLYLVKKELEDIGGQITVESVLNEGTIFTVRMPYVKK